MQTGELIDKGQSGAEFFVIDTTPDKEVHQVTHNLFISSQDASSNYEELKKHGITHILNLASSNNYFPKVGTACEVWIFLLDTL